MYSQAYIDYLVHFHGDRDYFECHELLEEHWKKTKEDTAILFGLALFKLLFHSIIIDVKISREPKERCKRRWQF